MVKSVSKVIHRPPPFTPPAGERERLITLRFSRAVVGGVTSVHFPCVKGHKVASPYIYIRPPSFQTVNFFLFFSVWKIGWAPDCVCVCTTYKMSRPIGFPWRRDLCRGSSVTSGWKLQDNTLKNSFILLHTAATGFCQNGSSAVHGGGVLT